LTGRERKLAVRQGTAKLSRRVSEQSDDDPKGELQRSE